MPAWRRIERRDEARLERRHVAALAAAMRRKLPNWRAQNHDSQTGPRFAGNHAPQREADPQSATALPTALHVVSYNIYYGHAVAQATTELAALRSQHALDIVLLQEMDESGTEAIARSLELNYVYYPSAVARHHGRNFGNAILARWPVEAAEKLILPHRSLTSRMVRTATRANVRIGARTVAAISAHTETIFTLPAFRRAQHHAVADAGGEEANHIVVGGDFNTVNRGDIRRLRRALAERGLEHVSADGPTLYKRGIKVTADHIFAKGFTVVEAGIFHGSASQRSPPPLGPPRVYSIVRRPTALPPPGATHDQLRPLPSPRFLCASALVVDAGGKNQRGDAEISRSARRSQAEPCTSSSPRRWTCAFSRGFNPRPLT
ncbi:MAG: endonuclease/exonuclease/phosphatase family protein [Anaerolineales bacterium]|nr:endonuclease/exonuclease/phosphatase family protein [Anaerolineales bacterium]